MREATLLERILEPGALHVVFQPIQQPVPGGWRPFGYEALVRGPAGTNASSAEVLFEYARRKRAEHIVDRACFRRALADAAELPDDVVISLNVHASTLGREPTFPGFIAETAALHRIAPQRLLIEIVEHAPQWNGPRFVEALAVLRGLGMRVALDDIGLGQSNYRMILECRPDCFKVDRYIVTGAGQDRHQVAVLRSIEQLARSFGALTVAEGVTSATDLRAVLDAGIGLVQGFLFGRPRSAGEIRAGSPREAVGSDARPHACSAGGR